MFITVVICTLNRAKSLRRTLESVYQPDNLRSLAWEVLVVDNGSTDRTDQVCSDFRNRFPEHFRSLVQERQGKSNALNSAVLAAKGEVLAFIDDDMVCSSHYIENVRSLFMQYPADAAQGRILLNCEGGHPKWMDRYLGLTVGWRDYGDAVADLDGTLSGGNMLVRANVFQRVGQFAPELGPFGAGMAEDTEISLRMKRAGCRLLYAPQILVWHQLSRKQVTRAVFRKRFFKQGRAEAYYAPLPVPLWRFAAYVVKETIIAELTAFGHRCARRPTMALRVQCEARSHAGFFWQHLQFKRGVRRALSTKAISPDTPRTET
jgi:glucosyl-dolichyl phosphate glucuronosyltransferase